MALLVVVVSSDLGEKEKACSNDESESGDNTCTQNNVVIDDNTKIIEEEQIDRPIWWNYSSEIL